MHRNILLRISAVLVVTTAVVATPLTSGPETARTHPPEIAPTPPGTAALRAYRNPETGALDVGVAPVSAAAYQSVDPTTQNALRRDADGLVEVHHADGSVSIHLQGRFQSVSVRKKGESGVVQVCTDDTDAIEKVLQGRTAPEVK